MAAEEEEVVAELEAVQAVYGDDCLVLDSYPPHLHLRIKPRTADVTSQQFVEAVIGLQASSQYPKEQPQIDLIDSKGLDEQRQKLLLSLIQDKACELSSCLMLVALCEEAVEQLTLMNHPDGDCPLCLNPLVEEDEQNNTLPFMKLMSCLHCFHSECIIRWWNWLQTEHITNPSDSSTETTHTIRDMGNKKDTFGDVESMGNCPVCRKVFQTKDFEHVRDLVGSHSSQLSYDVNEVNVGEKLLHSESENIRRQRFEAILKLQQEHNGLIEPKRNISVSPGMFPSQPVTMHSTVTNKSNEQEQKDSPSNSEMNTGDTSERPDTSMHRNPGMRKQRVPVKQWIRKENAESENIRGQRFEAILKLQQEHNGLIEPKRNISVSPGMFPSQPVTTHSTVTDKSNDQDQKDSPSTSEMNTGDTSERPDTSMHRNAGMGKQRVPVKQWIRKENARAE